MCSGGDQMKKTARKSQHNHVAVPVSVLAKEQEAQTAHAHLDKLLDEALEESFPASDSPTPAMSDTKATRH
jgi:hypothetical protein